IEESADSGDADLTAPGDELEVVGTNLSQTQVTGEAYAAALTAGGVALLRADHPQLQPEQVREALLEGSQEGPQGLAALNLPAASAHAAGIAQEAPLIDEDLVEEADEGPGVPVWTWFAVVGAVLLFGLLTLVLWVRGSSKDPYGVEAERQEEDERIAAERAAEADRTRRRGGRRRKPRRGCPGAFSLPLRDGERSSTGAARALVSHVRKLLTRDDRRTKVVPCHLLNPPLFRHAGPRVRRSNPSTAPWWTGESASSNTTPSGPTSSNVRPVGSEGRSVTGSCS